MVKFPFKSILTWDILLVISVFLCAFVIPVFPPSWGQMPIRIGFTLIFISGVMTMEKRNWRILYLTLAAFVMQWVSQIFQWEFIADVSKFLNVLFFLIVIFSLIREMAMAKVVTLATLGYGDVLPLKPYTRSLATLICISGQLYIATIIGILIGKFASGNDPAAK